MTNDLLFDIGEEYIVDEQPDSDTMKIAVYDDSSDNLSETYNYNSSGAPSTEPTNANYSQQTSTVTTAQLSGDYGFDNDSSVSFDFSDVSSGDAAEVTLDTTLLIFNFQSDGVAGQGAANDNAVANPAMDNTHATGDIDSLDYSSGAITATLN